jgi:hypothetical protein
MRTYDPREPLFALHIPKTGGTSILELFQQWFKDRVLTHYRNEDGSPPKKHNLASLKTMQIPVVVYGHYNSARGLGVRQYYPDARQFVTFLRDPFERALSRYFFFKQRNIPQGSLREVLLQPNPEWSMFCHFPDHVTTDNYIEVIETNFIEVGIIEQLETSLSRLAKKLGKTYNEGSVQRLNVSQKESNIPNDVRDEFIEKNSLEYLVYNYVLNK